MARPQAGESAQAVLARLKSYGWNAKDRPMTRDEFTENAVTDFLKSDKDWDIRVLKERSEILITTIRKDALTRRWAEYAERFNLNFETGTPTEAE